MTKAESIRIANIERYARNIGTDPGAAGRIFELSCASKYSRKTAVAKQGETDLYIKFGKGSVKAECKTNGGRIEALYAPNAPRFVIYKLDFVQKHKAGKHTAAYDEERHIDPVVIPTALFLAKLEEFGAIKSTNGKNPELAIQPSSKKWFEWLLDWPIAYNPEWRYTEDDFEGLA